MSRRDQIQMTEGEMVAYLAEQKTITLVSNGAEGFPHPMPMWFTRDADGAIRMATYKSSQKILNIQRDARVSLLAETGTEYAELRGVVLYGKAELIDDFDVAVDTLLRAGGGSEEGLPSDDEKAQPLRDAMRKTAEKRFVIRVAPERTVTWDHRKLGGVY
jgi:general stress protein 26